MDRKETEYVFQWADEYTKKHPDILNKSTNDIFEELDDGTNEMHHLRWGVMVRARMKNMVNFSYPGIIEYLSDTEDSSLMSEYIGYALQTQYGINMVQLLIEGNDKGKDMFPYTSANILYDEEFDINSVKSILNVFENNKENNLLDCTIRNYAGLIIKNNKEDYIINDYILAPTEIYNKLILQISRNLICERIDKADNMLSLLFSQDNPWCNFSALDLLELLSYGKTDFTDNYMENAICLMKNDKNQLRLIRTFLNYLECGESNKNYHNIYKYLKEIIKDSIEGKRIFLNHIEYKKELDGGTESLLQLILDTSFQKDEKILRSLDCYFSKKARINANKVLRQLEKVYIINKYQLDNIFLNNLSSTCSKLKSEQTAICKICFDRILTGNIQRFSWGVELFESLVEISGIENYLQNNMYNDEQLITILQGILYFSVSAEKICEFLFLTIPYFETTEIVWSLICNDFYPNYTGNLMEMAKKYKESLNKKQTEIALRLLQMNKEHLNKVKTSYENKDLRPSAQREYEYGRFRMEQNKRMNKESKQQSFLSRLFPDKFMKYGKRIGFVQYGPKGKMTYHVSEYAKIEVSRELPKAFLNNPHELDQKRKKYLKDRYYNEAHH